MRRIVLLVVAVFVVLVGYAPAAQAAGVPARLPTCVDDCPGGGTDDGGYFADVAFSGDAAPAGGVVRRKRIPATCWWLPAQLYTGMSVADPSNPDELEAWFKTGRLEINGSFAMFRGAFLDWASWKPAVDKMRAGQKITAYQPHCREDAPACSLLGFSGIVYGRGAGGSACGVAVGIGFFPTGAPPEPQVDPADLALVAHDEMDIPDPQVERNPKVTAMAGATLVGLPTWFWVTDPTSVGGAAGTRTIRASVGAVWAQVVAQTKGLHLSAPGGEWADCPPERAMTQYGRGVDESTACTISFDAASVGYPDGYPVDASTVWSAAWTGSGGTGGDLALLQRTTPVNVPVAESQTVVTHAR